VIGGEGSWLIYSKRGGMYPGRGFELFGEKTRSREKKEIGKTGETEKVKRVLRVRQKRWWENRSNDLRGGKRGSGEAAGGKNITSKPSTEKKPGTWGTGEPPKGEGEKRGWETGKKGGGGRRTFVIRLTSRGVKSGGGGCRSKGGISARRV